MQRHNKIIVRNVTIDFPFTPYPAQVEYMAAVIDALERGENALLESPTGTGKTLCLLCATLSWVRQKRARPDASGQSRAPSTSENGLSLLPRLGSRGKGLRTAQSGVMAGLDNLTTVLPLRIVYTSRTHAQLTQVVRELKRTEFATTVQMSILGSREHMCVHPVVSKQKTSQAQNSGCNVLRSDKGCRFFSRIQFQLATPSRLLAISGADGVGEVANNSGSSTGFCMGGDDETTAANSNANAQVPLQRVHDMEDLVKAGRSCGFCPYFYERAVVKDAEIVFLPYTYIFDPNLRRQLPFSLEDSILIVDEAHNLPSVLNSTSSTNLSPLDVSTAIHDVARAIEMVRAELKKGELDQARELEHLMTEEAFGLLKLMMVKLEDTISGTAAHFTGSSSGSKGEPAEVVDTSIVVQCPQVGSIQGGSSFPTPQELVLKGSYIFTLLANAKIVKSMWCGGGASNDGLVGGGGGSGGQRNLNDLIGEAISLLANSDAGSTGLSKVHQFLSNVFAQEMTASELDESCRVVMLGSSGGSSGQRQPAAYHPHAPHGAIRWTLGFWSLDTTPGMLRSTEGVHSLLLTSGTLSPIDHFAAELGVPFGVLLKGSHVIDSSQVFGSILARGPGGHRLNGSHSFRGSEEYRQALGMSLVNLARNVPNGMLCFFPSYVSMTGALDSWKMNGGASGVTVWGQLAELKTLFAEPTDGQELPLIVSNFQKAADEPGGRGALLFAVCRGKVSEGVDFADTHGRCVVVTGIPFANLTDLFVRLKRQYLTIVAPHRPKVNGRLFTGDDWYRNEAIRAVNQCIGRVIRHKDDYGAVVLADERFGGQRDAISSWISQVLVSHEQFRDAYAAMTAFFSKRKPARKPLSSSAAVSQADGNRCVTPLCVGTMAAPMHAAVAEAQIRQEQARRREHEEQLALAARTALQNGDLHHHIAGASTSKPQGAEGSSAAAAVTFVGGFKKQQLLPTGPLLQEVTRRDSATTLISSQPQGTTSVVATATTSSSSTSSSEYLAVVKAKLSSDQYDEFKRCLQKFVLIARERRKSVAPTTERSSCASEEGFKEQFTAAVWDLKAVFEGAFGGNCDEVEHMLVGLGAFLPQSHQSLYAQVLRKRCRGDPSIGL